MNHGCQRETSPCFVFLFFSLSPYIARSPIPSWDRTNYCGFYLQYVSVCYSFRFDVSAVLSVHSLCLRPTGEVLDSSEKAQVLFFSLWARKRV